MKKIWILIISLCFVFTSFSGVFANSQSITKGRWVNRSDGYKLSSKSDKTTKRYKMINFFSDQSFVMDSAKVKYYGKWSIEGDTISLKYNNQDVASKRGSIHDTHISIGAEKYHQYSSAVAGLMVFYEFTGFSNVSRGHLIMLLVGLIFIFLAIKYDYEPLLLIPIGFGIIIGNIPFFQAEGFNLQLGIYEQGSVFNYLYMGVLKGVYPPLIFLGIGAMTDFSSLISNPKLMLLGAAAQVGIFATLLGSILLGFSATEAGAIGIIGGADGPTAIFLSSRLAPHLIGPIAIAAYSYMALVPIIQPPFMRLLTTKKERLIRMRPPRSVSKLEKIMFPIVGLLLTAYISPSALPLLGMLFFGNLLKESTVTRRLADTARTVLIDIVTILLGVTVGASTQADVFLTPQSIKIFILGALSFMVATVCGILFAKFMNLFLSDQNKINPLIGNAGVSAVPDSARVSQMEGLKADPSNHLLMHAMAPNVSGVIGSAVAAGILLSFLL